jgi:hypothetical protein
LLHSSGSVNWSQNNRFTIVKDPQRFYGKNNLLLPLFSDVVVFFYSCIFVDKAYVERLEKEFMDTREELEEMRSVFEGIEAVKSALDHVMLIKKCCRF